MVFIELFQQFRWTASCFKLVWQNVALWTILYTFLSCLYRYVLIDKHRQMFELICIYASRYTELIPPPIAFLTGFYVTQVVSRWWDQFMSLPWPDSLAIKLANYCPGTVSTNTNIQSSTYVVSEI